MILTCQTAADSRHPSVRETGRFCLDMILTRQTAATRLIANPAIATCSFSVHYSAALASFSFSRHGGHTLLRIFFPTVGYVACLVPAGPGFLFIQLPRPPRVACLIKFARFAIECRTHPPLSILHCLSIRLEAIGNFDGGPNTISSVEHDHCLTSLDVSDIDILKLVSVHRFMLPLPVQSPIPRSVSASGQKPLVISFSSLPMILFVIIISIVLVAISSMEL